MKAVLRTLIWLCLIVWIGAELFFPVVAAITFATLTPDTHAAGHVVGACLRVLHYEALAAGTLLLVLIVAARRVGMFSPMALRISLALVVAMLALTAVSQFSIIPRMEAYRLEAGGTVDAAAANDPARLGFNRLHKNSVRVEGLILILGLVLVGVLADPQEPAEA